MRHGTTSHIAVFRSANRSAHAEAAKELITVSAISAIPFLVGVVAFLVVNDTGSNYAERATTYFSSALLQGQLFLVSVSFIATSLHRLWNSDHSYERPDVINVFAILLFGIIGIFYGVNPSFAKLRSSMSERMSVTFFIMSIIFYCYTAVLSYHRPKAIENTLEDEVKDLGDRLGERRSAEFLQSGNSKMCFPKSILTIARSSRRKSAPALLAKNTSLITF